MSIYNDQYDSLITLSSHDNFKIEKKIITWKIIFEYTEKSLIKKVKNSKFQTVNESEETECWTLSLCKFKV